MPSGLHRYYGQNHLHFITCSCYQRALALGSPQHRNLFVRVLDWTRERYRFSLFGYVVMPEHFHLLMTEPAIGNPSLVMQILKQTVSHQILQALRTPVGLGLGAPSSRREGGTLVVDASARMLLQKPERPGEPGKYQFWARRFYDFNVWTEKKKIEKLRYMHDNPVIRELVKHPVDWPWSSYRFYAFGDTRMLAMDPWSVNVPK